MSDQAKPGTGARGVIVSDSLPHVEPTGQEARAAVKNALEAGRRVRELIGGDTGRWKLDGRKVTDEAGDALISLAAYLNDVDYFELQEQVR